MSDLTEFLLARIAEDEERATFVQAQQAGQNWSPFEPWRLSWQDEYDLLCIEPARVLAECEAKRQIVDTYVDMSELGGTERIEQRLTLRWVMELHALPYADHPDYRDEWNRP